MPPPECFALGARLARLADELGNVTFADTDTLAEKIQKIRDAL
jgi:hypothetical protein